MGSIWAKHALTDAGWQQSVRVQMDAAGRIATLETEVDAQHEDMRTDILLPGMSNVHSHAFQYAMAGLTEIAASGDDNFWSWREVMYSFLAQLSPEQVGGIARYLYVQMLKAGYTRVGEFHYLHHAPDGKPYANPAEMSLHILEAARDSGIGLTHLPVLYAHSNFGGKPPVEGQRRFIHDVDSYLELLQSLQRYTTGEERLLLGWAPHSLRAVTAEEIQQVQSCLPSLGMLQVPVHMHVSEQQKEVDDCLLWCGQRPIEWLLEHMPVDSRWCLIHATHASQEEAQAMAKAGCVVGLCPSTEANLGDGIFPAVAYSRQGGRAAIGTDSHVTINPLDECRLLEYSQRLRQEKRALLAEVGFSVGASLYDQLARGGAQATGIDAGSISVNQRADLVGWSLQDPRFAGKVGDQWLDTAIFTLPHPPVQHVWVGGRAVVVDGRHPKEEAYGRQYISILEKLAVGI